MNILIVAAHPDDEILGCGATINKHFKNGDVVNVAIMATGLASRGEFDKSDFLKLKDCAVKASKILGVKDIFFLDKKDNMMDSEPSLLVIKEIEILITKTQPDIIYTHYYGDLNIDHQIISNAVQVAARPLPGVKFIEIRLFEVLSSTEWGRHLGKGNFVPNLYIDVNNEIDCKIKALKQYKTEMRDFPHPRSIENNKYLSRLRGTECGLLNAEAFLVIRSLK